MPPPEYNRVTVRNYVHEQIAINLNSWKEEVDTAIGLAVQPPKPESRFFWYLALAGNLVWAATCLIAPPAAAGAAAAELAMGEAAESFLTRKDIPKQLATAISTNIATSAKVDANDLRSLVTKTMNFGGAAVGSGAIEQAVTKQDKEPGPEDGKNLVRDIIGKRRANLEDDYKKKMRDVWTEQLLMVWKQAGNVEPLDLFDLFLWAQMFPRIPYNEDRINAIRDSARGIVESTLADYNRQWQKYQADLMAPTSHQAEALWAMGTLAVQGPFKPKLVFKVD